MPNTQLSAVLVAICFLAITFNDGLIAQALPLAPTLALPAVAENKTGMAPQQNNVVSPQQSNVALPDPNNIYDTTNPDYTMLQKSNEVFTGPSLDDRGAIDWMKALNSDDITPRADILGTVKMELLDTDIILKNTKAMPYVKFSHSSHTRWLACANCHENIFTSKTGSNKINMTKIFRGNYCGVCHGQVSFKATFSCERCHNVTRDDTKPGKGVSNQGQQTR